MSTEWLGRNVRMRGAAGTSASVSGAAGTSLTTIAGEAGKGGSIPKTTTPRFPARRPPKHRHGRRISGYSGKLGATGGKAGKTGNSGAAGSTNASTDDLEEVRQICVDTSIISARPKICLPQTRGADVEAVRMRERNRMEIPAYLTVQPVVVVLSDSRINSPGRAECVSRLSSRRWGGMGSTLSDVLVFCLNQMWAEGEPEEGRAACMQDYAGCFLQHGHYINMTDTTYAAVSCVFITWQ